MLPGREVEPAEEAAREIRIPDVIAHDARCGAGREAASGRVYSLTAMRSGIDGGQLVGAEQAQRRDALGADDDAVGPRAWRRRW